jgi:DNA-binding CsgD family transcriptional regulator
MAAACEAVSEECDVEWCAATYSSASIPFGPVTRLVPPTSEARRAVDVFRRAIAAIAERERPVVVAVDDAHLLDDASATLVHRLALDGVARVVLTARTGESTPDPITALWKDGDAEYVRLQPLSHEEVHELLVVVVGGPVEEPTVERLWQVTNGNPLFLREILAVAAERDELARVRGQWRWQGAIGAHQRVADLVHARLAGLDPDEADAVRLLAFGEPLPMSILSRVVSPEVLTKLGHRALVVPGGSEAERALQLAHPLYGEVLRAELSPLEEVDACRRLAHAGLAAGAVDGSRLRWVSVWALEAGVELPAELVADAARAALDAADAERAEQLARAALAREPTFEMALVRASALSSLERFEDADAVFADALALASTPQELASAAMGRAQVLQIGLGRFDAAEELLREVAASNVDESWRDVLAAQRARLLAVEGWHEEAGALAIPMLDAHDERVRLRAVTPAATRLTLEGRTDRVLEVTEALLEPARRRREELPHAPMWVGSARAYALFYAGELAETEATLDMMGRSSQLTAQEDRGYLSVGYGRVALSQGRVATAARHLRVGIGLLDGANRLGRQAWGLGLLAEALTLAGDQTGAEAAAAELDRSPRPANRIYQVDCKRARAWTLVGQGMVSAAEAALVEVADESRRGAPVCELFALHDALRIGSGTAVVDRLVDVAGRVDGRAARAFAEHAAARRDRSPERLDAVSTEFEQSGATLLAAEAAAEASVLHREAGHTGSASLAAARAERLRGSCEGAFTPALALLDEGSRLTPREREIAELAARGMSSPDIARELVVSVRTVDNHLQHVYAKLGISRRADLAARLGPS